MQCMEINIVKRYKSCDCNYEILGHGALKARNMDMSYRLLQSAFAKFKAKFPIV